MVLIDVEELRGDPERWLAAVRRGERVIVVRDGETVAQLEPPAEVPAHVRPFVPPPVLERPELQLSAEVLAMRKE